jgi:hypothetical protein
MYLLGIASHSYGGPMIYSPIAQQKPRGVSVIAALLTLQGFALLGLTILIVSTGMIAAVNAKADHHATGGALAIGFAVIGGGLFLALSALTFLLAWAWWNMHRWTYGVVIALEVLSGLICALSLTGGINWWTIAYLGGTIIILILTIADGKVRMAFHM